MQIRIKFKSIRFKTNRTPDGWIYPGYKDEFGIIERICTLQEAKRFYPKLRITDRGPYIILYKGGKGYNPLFSRGGCVLYNKWTKEDQLNPQENENNTEESQTT
jgi:hypothetical protein